MASIDDLFKKPSLPSNKRKSDLPPNPYQHYKSPKLTPNGDAKGHNHGAVEEEGDDVEAGPARPLASDDEEEQGPGDDKEGRFFGGGLDKGATEVLDFIDEREQDGVQEEKYDSAWLRRLGVNFEKRISKNAELRAKFEDDPQKFMGSEADLDADVKALSILTEHPELYEEFAKLGCASSLVSLLSHENTDIAIDAIEIISELTDEEVQAEQAQWDTLVDAMLEADLLSLLIQNFDRLDETIESDRSGVYHSLSVLENLASQPRLADTVGHEAGMLKWLLSRVQRKETLVGQNKQYAAEVLSILLQSSAANRKRLTELDGVDLLLQLLSAYRKRDPAKDSEEEEFVENVFDCLTAVVDEEDGKQQFVKAEGVELCLIMLREGKMSKPRALRLLDHALGGQHGGDACSKLVEGGGLKKIFSIFMKKQNKETTEHLLGIMVSLLRLLPVNSAERVRTLAKFIERDYEKILKLIALRHAYVSKLIPVHRRIDQERNALSAEEQSAMEDEWFSRRLDAGLYCLQSIDVILAWLLAEDDGARARIVESLSASGMRILDIRQTLFDMRQNVVDESGEEGQMINDMLSTLLTFLE